MEFMCWDKINSKILSDGMARFFFLSANVPNSFATTGIWTHINRVAPSWDLLKDDLTTELHGCGWEDFFSKAWISLIFPVGTF